MLHYALSLRNKFLVYMQRILYVYYYITSDDYIYVTSDDYIYTLRR